MTTKKVVFARQAEYLATLTEDQIQRTAKRNCNGLDFDVVFQTWPSRKAMAKTIRTQQQREYRPTDWRAVRELSTTEGY